MNTQITEQGYDCQECGYRGKPGQEFHSYESCILYLLDTNPERMEQKHKNYIWRSGIATLRDRVERKEVGWHLVHGGWAVLYGPKVPLTLVSRHIDPLEIEIGYKACHALGIECLRDHISEWREAA